MVANILVQNILNRLQCSMPQIYLKMIMAVASASILPIAGNTAFAVEVSDTRAFSVHWVQGMLKGFELRVVVMRTNTERPHQKTNPTNHGFWNALVLGLGARI